MYKLKLIDWNIGGAKYLELKSREYLKSNEYLESDEYLKLKTKGETEESREDFRANLNRALDILIRRERPAIVMLQEVVRYHPEGDQSRAEHVIDIPDGYDYYTLPLIDTVHHSHQGKWDKVRTKGRWSKEAFFSQGNAILVNTMIPHFHVFRLPAIDQPTNSFKDADPMETVKLESGLYFGDRNTEPRAAIVMHLVLSKLIDMRKPDAAHPPLNKPLDIFAINLHLTTLTMEREGVPDIDEEAAYIRQRQIEIVLNGIVSRYNRWRRDKYRIRGEKTTPDIDETHERHPPIWIIGGDFNFTPESIEYLTMVRRGFIDLMPSHSVGTKASGLGKDPTLTLDYVFAGPRFEAIDPAVAAEGIKFNRVEVSDDTKVSDHFPLIIDLPIVLSNP
jgi:Metal-dependent hydrolase